MPFVAVALVVAALGVALAARAWPAAGPSRWARLRIGAGRDLRDALLARRAWPTIALTSTVVVAGHAATFLIAAETGGVSAPLSRMLPLALLVLIGAALPNVGGWGPREGITAWAFAAAGLGASQGVATAVAYGVMVFVATLPGAVVLVVAVASPARHRGPRPRGGRLEVLARGNGTAMAERPYTLLSCSVSLDGYLGDQTPRLALSNEADFDRVDEVRASCDAIMVGAVTVRTDNPRLLVRSQSRRDRAPRPRARAVTDEGHRDRARGPRRALELLHAGETEKLVYASSPRVAGRRGAPRAGGDDRRRRPARPACDG